ncbi:uncharacterized protein P174DRAFT_427999 [Aspergillus novofumigatus IBT 16806]|uniref:Uncharacterized protein n=1 Tax=Aspergillus novofumigatus (strain IBT 16806) TaxID=1392255 RepID=A0A2I1CFS3_ASPN1|nr:uncharacterized protein P174DRAFT_427999 [Aspergillus novofumigatus IBT 16806]PKX96450.1 hypothetical protein P174DRAFT_427999 [Aspergillus novofumigatus IBT 16806]
MATANPETISIQTDIEKAKLARRQTEYAVLKDALRRRIPVTHIPFLVAAASARSVPACSQAYTRTCSGRVYEDKVYPHLRGVIEVPTTLSYPILSYHSIYKDE